MLPATLLTVSPLFVGGQEPQQPMHILAHLQGTQSPDTEANLAKEPKFPHTLHKHPNLCRTREIYNDIWTTFLAKWHQ